jgi:flavorubredoxin
MSEVYEIAGDIYRIAVFTANSPVTYSQFLIKDDRPLLYHTGPKALFPETLEAVKRVIDPTKLRYISWSHLESDECGAVNEILRMAPEAEPVAGALAVFLGVGDFFTKPLKGMNDEEVLDLGRHKLRFLVTPHVPHCWDAVQVFDETTGTLFASDLFTHLGPTKPITDRDIVQQALTVHNQIPDYLPIGPHTERALKRLEILQPRVLAGHHVPAYTGNATQALRDLRTGLSDLAKKLGGS